VTWAERVEAGENWSNLWNGYVICGACSGIRRYVGPCPACGAPEPSMDLMRVIDESGEAIEVIPAQMGAEGRYEDYVFLRLMQREWQRSDTIGNDLVSYRSTSPRAAIVLLFWTYFETKIERLLRAGMNGNGRRLIDDTLERYASVGSRMDRLYKVVFNSSYAGDLKEVGYESVWTFIREVQERRNAFIHGDPSTIDDALVNRVVKCIEDEHCAWIAVFNKRCTHPSSAS
jgi:hypothetical protein